MNEISWLIVFFVLCFLMFLAFKINKDKRKLFLYLPFFALLVITPLYTFLDMSIFVKVFGCGCVPSTQTNMLKIGFNSNDLRITVYLLMTIIIVIYGIKQSKKIENRYFKYLYIVSIIIFNLLIAYSINKAFMWM